MSTGTTSQTLQFTLKHLLALTYSRLLIILFIVRSCSCTDQTTTSATLLLLVSIWLPTTRCSVLCSLPSTDSSLSLSLTNSTSTKERWNSSKFPSLPWPSSAAWGCFFPKSRCFSSLLGASTCFYKSSPVSVSTWSSWSESTSRQEKWAKVGLLETGALLFYLSLGHAEGVVFFFFSFYLSTMLFTS